MRILHFVIPSQKVRLFLITKCLTLEVFEEPFEGVKLRPIHGRLLFHLSIAYLLTHFLVDIIDELGYEKNDLMEVVKVKVEVLDVVVGRDPR